jgi:hypothetical protein
LFPLLVNINLTRPNALPAVRFNSEMRQLLLHADVLKDQGSLQSFQHLGLPATARSARVRVGAQHDFLRRLSSFIALIRPARRFQPTPLYGRVDAA